MAAEPQPTAAPERRGQMVEVATRLFSRTGYHGTSVREIAEATGIRAATVYAHIRGKEDLLFAIVERAAAEFLDRMEEVVTEDLPPDQKLRRAMRAHVSVVAADRDAARVFLHEWTALGGERRARALELRDRYEDLWDQVVRPLPGARRRVTMARILVLSAANWVYTWYDPAGPLSADRIADAFTDLLLQGLGGGAGGDGSGKDTGGG